MEIPVTLESFWLRAQRDFQAGGFGSARSNCESVLAIAPQHSGAHLMLSNLSSHQKRHRLSIQHALAATSKMGRQSLHHVAMVALKLISVGEYESAYSLIKKIDPTHTPAPTSLAEFSQQLSLLEQHEDALNYIDAAIDYGLQGDWVSYLRGNYLKFLGRLDEAAAEYEKSLVINPYYAYSHLAIAYLGKTGNTNLKIDRLKKAISGVPIDFRDLPALHYALFKELDSTDDTESAWRALEAGFSAKRKTITHDAAEETAIFNQLIEASGVGFVGSTTSCDEQKTPIFIVGMPRTGTTLLERILGGHSEVVLCGELNDFRMQYKWVSDYYCLGVFNRTALTYLDKVDYAQIGQRYREHTAWRTAGSTYFTDKNTSNFMMVGLILRALPNAKIIHLKRNPMDSCFSNLKELFGTNAHPYSYNFSELACHYKNYSRLMAHWHALAPGRILDVNYEEMVSDPEAISRRVMNYCGLEYSPDQIQIESNSLPVSTASSSQVRQPIHTRNIDGWKRYATQLAPLEGMLNGQGSL